MERDRREKDTVSFFLLFCYNSGRRKEEILYWNINTGDNKKGNSAISKWKHKTERQESRMKNLRKTKIICTLGPATDQDDVLRQLMMTGMDAARFNFSHGSHEEQGNRLKKVQKFREEYVPRCRVHRGCGGCALQSLRRCHPAFVRGGAAGDAVD